MCSVQNTCPCLICNLYRWQQKRTCLRTYSTSNLVLPPSTPCCARFDSQVYLVDRELWTSNQYKESPIHHNTHCTPSVLSLSKHQSQFAKFKADPGSKACRKQARVTRASEHTPRSRPSATCHPPLAPLTSTSVPLQPAAFSSSEELKLELLLDLASCDYLPAAPLAS